MKLFSFPLIAHYPLAGPPLPHTPPFTGRPGHTHTYSSFLFSAPRKPHVLLAALTCYVCFALKALKLPVFSYELTLLTFSVSYLWIISYIYFKNTKNLFIHIAHYPVRRFLRDIPTFLKCPLHSLVGAGVGSDRYQGDSAHETQPNPSLF